MKTLETERLVLRSFREEDLDDMFEYARDPDVGPNAGWAPHTDREISRAIIRSFIEKDEVWAVVGRESGRVIGSFGLHSDRLRDYPGARMIGYVLAKPYWGRGLIPEAVQAVLRYAFTELELRIVSVYHYSFNDRSRRVIEKSGFCYEGRLRNASVLYDGRVCDSMCYSITREEFLCREH